MNYLSAYQAGFPETAGKAPSSFLLPLVSKAVSKTSPLGNVCLTGDSEGLILVDGGIACNSEVCCSRFSHMLLFSTEFGFQDPPGNT